MRHYYSDGQAVIDGKLYDTATADDIGSVSSDGVNRRLFRTPKGSFFTADLRYSYSPGNSPWIVNIQPISRNAAITFAGLCANPAQILAQHFGVDVEEA